MKLNQKGYTEIVTVSLIIGIIGSIFIAGVFIWQEISKTELFKNQILKIEKNISSEECTKLGGETINTLNQKYCDSPENFLGTIDGMRCPCICCKQIKTEEKINSSKNLVYIEIARQHILNKPSLQLDISEQPIMWDKLDELLPGFSKINPEWIISQDINIEYVAKDKYETPYDYLNDKYTVSWFFIPGCEEDKNSNDKPNWFNDDGHQCLGGYSLNIIINPNKIISKTELHVLD